MVERCTIDVIEEENPFKFAFLSNPSLTTRTASTESFVKIAFKHNFSRIAAMLRPASAFNLRAEVLASQKIPFKCGKTSTTWEKLSYQLVPSRGAACAGAARCTRPTC